MNFAMKNYLIYTSLLLLSIAFLCYCHLANRPEDTTQETVSIHPEDEHIAPTSTALPPLSLTASGACVMDVSTGRILYGKNETTPLPMASTTKIMTCILALEHGNLEDTVTFSQKAASMPKVHLGASSGRTFVLKDLLYSLMLESHNDTAVAIAEHIGGSVEGFASMMNAKAAELGMTQTCFVTPNGLDADGHASTPTDMCLLAAYACQNEQFLHIIKTPSMTICDTSGNYRYSLVNLDAFLTSYEGAIGIKTGFTSKAGYCFVGAAKRNGRTLVSCVLASGWPPNKSYKWSDTKALMNFGFDNFSMLNISAQDLSSFYVKVENGKGEAVHVSQPELSPLLLSSADRVDIRYELPSIIHAPVNHEIPIGFIHVLVNNNVQNSYPIYPVNDVDKIQFRDSLYNIFDLFLSL